MTNNNNHAIYLVAPPPFPLFPIPKIPYSILALGSYLEHQGYMVKLFDGGASPSYVDDLIQAIQDKKPLFVGLTVMTPSIGFAIDLTRRLRKTFPDLLLVWGGPHAALFPEQVVQNGMVDIACTGEGELFCDTLIRKINSNEPLTGIADSCVMVDGQPVVSSTKLFVEAENLPLIDYDLLNIGRYIETHRVDNVPHKQIGVIAGYGCPYRCNFCINVVLQRKHRGKSAKKIVGEIKNAHEKYGVTYFSLMDEFFFNSLQRVENIIEEINALDFKITWRVQARADSFKRMITPELLRDMKDSGCYAIGIGAETGSQRILDRINKHILVEDIVRANEMCDQAGITITNAFMVGIPGEELTDVIATAQLCDKLISRFKRSVVQYPQLFRPYPGSPLYDEAISHGLNVPKTLEEWEIAQQSIQKKIEMNVVELSYLSYRDSVWIKNSRETQVVHKIICRRWDMSRLTGNTIKKNLRSFLINLPLLMLSFLRLKLNFWRFLGIDRLVEDFINGLMRMKRKAKQLLSRPVGTI